MLIKCRTTSLTHSLTQCKVNIRVTSLAQLRLPCLSPFPLPPSSTHTHTQYYITPNSLKLSTVTSSKSLNVFKVHAVHHQLAILKERKKRNSWTNHIHNQYKSPQHHHACTSTTKVKDESSSLNRMPSPQAQNTVITTNKSIRSKFSWTFSKYINLASFKYLHLSKTEGRCLNHLHTTIYANTVTPNV